MKNKSAAELDLQSRLRCLPEMSPPEDLQQRVMESLLSRRKSLVQRLKDIISSMIPWGNGSVGPVLAMASIAIAFFTGMQIDRYLEGPQINLGEGGEVSVVRETTDAESAFYLGRSLLASDKPEEALQAFRRAALLDPDQPRYTLWQGAAYYALGREEDERKSYRQLIDRRPNYLPARLNLAHNLLQNGMVAQAKQLYEEVLQYDPQEKTALYNRALSMHLQDDKNAEADAWKEFLHQYRTGIWAYRALRHLFEIGDYSYRSYQIGYRTIILNQEALLGLPGAARNQELQYLAEQFSRQGAGNLNIVVYRQNDTVKAQQIALSLRTTLNRFMPETGGSSVQISWFGEPEAMVMPDQDSVYLPEGVLIFSAPKNKRKEERI